MKFHLVPGLHDKAHREAFFAGARKFREAGRFRYCKATAKSGNPCRGLAMRGTEYCLFHAPADVKRERRWRRLARLRSAEEVASFNRREAVRCQREIWRRDRWAPGATIALGPREAQFQADLAGFGLNPATFSPATLDQAKWCWQNMQTGRLTRQQFADRVRWHQDKD